MNFEIFSQGNIFIVVGIIGILITVVIFFIYLHRSSHRRFENFKAAMSYGTHVESSNDYQEEIKKLVFNREHQWHKGKGSPSSSGVGTESGLYASYTHSDLEKTEKL